MTTSTRAVMVTLASTSVSGGRSRRPMAAKENVAPHKTDKKSSKSQSVGRIGRFLLGCRAPMVYALPIARSTRIRRQPRNEPACLGGGQNPGERRHELAVVVNDHVWREVPNGARRVTEGDGDAGYVGGLGRDDINLAVADHHRPLDTATGTLNRTG